MAYRVLLKSNFFKKFLNAVGPLMRYVISLVQHGSINFVPFLN